MSTPTYSISIPPFQHLLPLLYRSVLAMSLLLSADSQCTEAEFGSRGYIFSRPDSLRMSDLAAKIDLS